MPDRSDRARFVCAALAAAAGAAMGSTRLARAAAEPFYMGSDISLLPFIESRSGTYRDGGQVRPAEQILVNHGNNLFRLRLFVNPDPNYDNASNRGAIQDQAYTIALAQRLKATGAKILLDLHYSDTWADPGDQAKPAAWASQNFATLQTTVRNYTRDTLESFRNAGVMPEMVQVGNEITNGMLYGSTVVPPTGGQVVYAGPNQNQSWANFGALLNSAIQGVREVDAQTPAQHTKIAIHVDGGDAAGRAQYFFNQLTSVAQVPADSYDVMGMSYYGTTAASLSTLETNLEYLANNYAQKVMVLETNKQWKGASSGAWPSTPAGQRDFLVAVRDVVRNLPNDRGQGVVWWYPESIQIPGTFMWQSGAVALFDDDTDGAGADGHDALTALGAFAWSQPTWNTDADGNWYDAMSWTGGVPMFAGNAAQFGAAITAPRTVTLNGSRSAAIVSFDSPHAYTIVGGGGSVLTLDAVAGNAAISVISGSHTIAAPVMLNDNLDIAVTGAASKLRMTGPLTATGRAINKSGAGTVEIPALRAAALNVTAGMVRLRPDGSPAGASRINSLTLADGGKIDLTDNKLITASPVGTWNGTAYTAVSGMVDRGRGNAPNAQWDGSGIVTSDTRAVNQNDLTSIGVVDASDKFPISGTATALFAGQTVNAADTLVMFTWGGDANLDGKIDILDYGQIDFHVGSSGSVFGWFNGDFNYDGKINILDYGIIDFNVAAQDGVFTSSSAAATPRIEGRPDGASAIPEPAHVALFSLAALLTRHRSLIVANSK